MQKSDFDGLAVRPCLRSGMCCKTSACAFGIWDNAAQQCRHLQIEQESAAFTRYSCAIKAQIDALPDSAGARYNPAFGQGCCMPMFNPNRMALLRHRDGLRREAAKPDR